MHGPLRTYEVVLALLVASAAMLGCGGRGKEDAALAIERARLSVAEARKAGANLSDATLREAEGDLREAEAGLKKRDFKSAERSALRSVEWADKAKADAVGRKSAPKTPARKAQKSARKTGG